MAKFTVKEFYELISLLRIDVFMFLYIFGFMLPNVTLNQLVQDKVCLNELKMGKQFCLNLEKAGAQHEYEKNFVLEYATSMKNYQTLTATAPGVILSLFVGYWIDSYPGHLKYLMSAPALGAIIQAAMIIYDCFNFERKPISTVFSFISIGLSGGIGLVLTGAYIYTTRMTPAKYRSLRFAVLEFFAFSGFPIATALGGKLLASPPWFSGQFRNYIMVYIITIATNAIGIIWIVIFLNDSGAPPPDEEAKEVKQSKDKNIVNGKVDLELQLLESAKQNELTVDQSPVVVSEKPKQSSTRTIDTIKDIFNLNNVRNMIKTCCRARPNNGRSRLWHLMIGMTVVLVGHLGEHVIGFQFTQKVYHWDAEYFSYINSALMLIPSIIQTVSPAILIHKFHLHDTIVAGIGCISIMMSTILKGGILESYAYFIAYFLGAFSGLLPIAFRSLVSRIIDFNEIGQVYALLACIESCAPMISSIFYSTIFNATIENYPGIVFHAVTLIFFYPLLIVVWLDLTRPKWDAIAVASAVDNGNSKNNNNDSAEHRKSITSTRRRSSTLAPENFMV